ncbi:hypothetical protein CDCA_CDCA03G0982 [Cyanidium caldarium]|uniref:Eukaryotic translation initiation factor 3 subunit D n=1 Tax=Cyanidium caldarium TaxID=2771 RepID=A0AAV9IRH5_CYACA|nr:hypothetical protein CDCA_CDCA03G0982 [Cyanidium caldarium]
MSTARQSGNSHTSLKDRLSVLDNPDGWGPPLHVPPMRFQDVPYAPFSASDRYGRVAEIGSGVGGGVGYGAHGGGGQEDERDDYGGRRGRRFGRGRERQRWGESGGAAGEEDGGGSMAGATADPDGFTLVEVPGRSGDRNAGSAYAASGSTYRERGGTYGSRPFGRRGLSGYGRSAAPTSTPPPRSAPPGETGAGGAWAAAAARSARPAPPSAAASAAAATTGTNAFAAIMAAAAVAPAANLASGLSTGDARADGSLQDALQLAGVEVQPGWVPLEEIAFAKLNKLEGDGELPSAEELIDAGSLEYYDKSNDRISCKQPKVLARFEHRAFHYVSTSEDPLLMRLWRESGDRPADDNSAAPRRVFATGTVAALLMASTRTCLPWDVIVERRGDALFFDKRRGSQIDLITVNENAHGIGGSLASAMSSMSVANSLNSPQSLALEATLINQNFSQAVLRHDTERFRFPQPNPWTRPDEQEASIGYRYRRWRAAADDWELYVRCEVDGALEGAGAGRSGGASPESSGASAFLVIKALNEVLEPNHKPGTGGDWRSRLDAQRGGVLATELKNNTAKLIRWTVQALMAGADFLKLGFVSRSNPRDINAHVILGTQVYKPQEFAKQIGVNMRNAWAVLAHLVEACYRHLGDGERGILLREPQRPALRLYRLPTA